MPHLQQRVPKDTGPRGSFRSGELSIEANNVYGEMMWRNDVTMYLYKRGDFGWECVECAHTPEQHFDSDPFDSDPVLECRECNCGNRTGR